METQPVLCGSSSDIDEPLKCVTSGGCFNLNYVCLSEYQVLLSPFHDLMARAAASMSKKGLSHSDGVSS